MNWLSAVVVPLRSIGLAGNCSNELAGKHASVLQ